MEGSGVVTGEGTNIVGAEDGDEDVKFALVEELVERDEQGERVDGDAVSGDSDEKRNRVRKGEVESILRIQECKGAETRRAGGGRRAEDGSHARRERAGTAGAAAAVRGTRS